ncbi:hypothetical protein ACR71G_17795, partial [Xenorhabdus bovienii]|uniref:hypothetical protein n=1 Tax=Xenorhabdus bovienii TaxID=40576 RepID=UPI003DA290F3
QQGRLAGSWVDCGRRAGGGGAWCEAGDGRRMKPVLTRGKLRVKDYSSDHSIAGIRIFSRYSAVFLTCGIN